MNSVPVKTSDSEIKNNEVVNAKTIIYSQISM